MRLQKWCRRSRGPHDSRFTFFLIFGFKRVFTVSSGHFFITSFTAELSEANSGGFIFTGSLETGRSGHSATLLGNGAVLVTGGTGYGGNALATAEMYQ